MLSDVAVASDRATFRGPELLRGIVDSWYSDVMPKLIGVALTRDIMITGRRLSAVEAVQHGLISRIVRHDESYGTAEQAAREALQSPPEAREQFKRMVHDDFGVIDEATFFASLRGAEVHEGVTAFAEKRAPNWIPEQFRNWRV